MYINICIGSSVEIKDLEILCEKLVESLLEVCCLKNLCEYIKKLFISEEFEKFKVDYISFLGGIGEYIG